MTGLQMLEDDEKNVVKFKLHCLKKKFQTEYNDIKEDLSVFSEDYDEEEKEVGF